MTQSVDTFAQESCADALDEKATRRRSIRRSVLSLSLFFLALVALIVITADMRRRSWAVTYATEYGRQLEARVTTNGDLPSDLSADPAGEFTVPKLYTFEWLSPAQARALRGVADPVLVAQTLPIQRRFASDGRGVVIFEAGRFIAKWMSLAEFDELMAVQKRHIVLGNG